MSNATRSALTSLTMDKTPFEAIAALDGYVTGILKQLRDGDIGLTKARRDIDEAYGYKEHFRAEAWGEAEEAA
jgi:hypothetical protein